MNENQELVRQMTYNIFMYLDRCYILHESGDKLKRELHNLLDSAGIRYNVHTTIEDLLHMRSTLYQYRQLQTGFLRYNDRMSLRKVQKRMKRSIDTIKADTEAYPIEAIESRIPLRQSTIDNLYALNPYFTAKKAEMERMGHGVL